MKKVMFVMALAVAMIACNSVDSKIKKLEKAIEKKDCAKIEKIADELDKVDKKDITKEQQEKIGELAIKAALTTDCYK